MLPFHLTSFPTTHSSRFQSHTIIDSRRSFHPGGGGWRWGADLRATQSGMPPPPPHMTRACLKPRKWSLASGHQFLQNWNELHSKLASFPGLLTLAFVACSTNAGEVLQTTNAGVRRPGNINEANSKLVQSLCGP